MIDISNRACDGAFHYANKVLGDLGTLLRDGLIDPLAADPGHWWNYSHHFPLRVEA